MPKSTKHLALARQWQLLNLIPTRMPGITARELTERLKDEGFSVSKRTVERDLNELSLQFGLATNTINDRPPFKWYYATQRNINLGSIELIDAVSLALAGDILQQMLPQNMLQSISGKIEQARNKLKSIKGNPMAKWSEKIRFVSPTLTFLQPKIRAKVMEEVQTALVNERQLKVSYASFNEKPKRMVLHPLGLVLRGQVSYLVAKVDSYDDVRLFAVHRIESVKLLDEDIKIPEGYSLDDYIDQGGMDFGLGREFKLKAILEKALAMYLSETPLSGDQKINYKNNQWQLTATVRDSWQLHFWILSQGSKITITQPKKLRNRIIDELEQCLGNYR